LLKALKWAEDLMVTHIIFKSDCKIAIEKIKSLTIADTMIGAITLECRKILVQNPNFTVEFMKTQANSVGQEGHRLC